ncbi:hypothetical protein BTA51_16300 [Hahella sp. CCB-MM4]|nr:hypothetical protein BTA51_16300 [Hahella sp. CCB-MM4]
MNDIDHGIYIIAIVLLELSFLPLFSSMKCSHCRNRMIYRRSECSACGARYITAQNHVGNLLNLLSITFLAISLWLQFSNTINIRPGLLLAYLITGLFIIEVLRAIIPNTSSMKLDYNDAQTKLVLKTTDIKSKRAEP